MSERLSAFDLLEGDVNGHGLRTLKEALLTMKMSVKRKMDAGLGPEEFAAAKRVLASIDAAEETLTTLYERMVG